MVSKILHAHFVLRGKVYKQSANPAPNASITLSIELVVE
jgi:hypothetical protein